VIVPSERLMLTEGTQERGRETRGGKIGGVWGKRRELDKGGTAGDTTVRTRGPLTRSAGSEKSRGRRGERLEGKERGRGSVSGREKRARSTANKGIYTVRKSRR